MSYHKDDFLKETQLKKSNKDYTYGDYVTWTDGKRYELIDGTVYNMTPAPSRLHQTISRQLLLQIGNYLDDKDCEVYDAPFDVRLPEGTENNESIKTVVQPDLLIVCDHDKLDDLGCKGVPDLIIEIVSTNSEHKDRKIKLDLYEKHGVKEYWIVDYNEKTVSVYLLKSNQKYGKPDIYSKNDMLAISLFKDFKIDLKVVFKGIF